MTMTDCVNTLSCYIIYSKSLTFLQVGMKTMGYEEQIQKKAYDINSLFGKFCNFFNIFFKWVHLWILRRPKLRKGNKPNAVLKLMTFIKAVSTKASWVMSHNSLFKISPQLCITTNTRVTKKVTKTIQISRGLKSSTENINQNQRTTGAFKDFLLSFLFITGEIGGNMGLFLGCSVLTICEFLEFLISHITARLCNRQVEDSPA